MTLSLVDVPSFKRATSISIDALAFKHTTSSSVDAPTFKCLMSSFVDVLAFKCVTSSSIDAPPFKHLTSSFIDVPPFKRLTSSFVDVPAFKRMISSSVHAPALSTQPQTLLIQLLSNATSSSGPPQSTKLWQHLDKLRRLDNSDYAFLPLQTLKHVLSSHSNIGNAHVKEKHEVKLRNGCSKKHKVRSWQRKKTEGQTQKCTKMHPKP